MLKGDKDKRTTTVFSRKKKRVATRRTKKKTTKTTKEPSCLGELFLGVVLLIITILCVAYLKRKKR